jgi:hypothetical protein
MNTPSKNPGNTAKTFGLLGVGLCAVCCALPVAGLVGGAGILASIALYAEKAALFLVILAIVSFGLWYFRKRKARRCDIGCECKTTSKAER